MKKVFSVLAVAAMLVAVAACNNQPKEEEAPAEEAIEAEAAEECTECEACADSTCCAACDSACTEAPVAE